MNLSHSEYIIHLKLKVALTVWDACLDRGGPVENAAIHVEALLVAIVKLRNCDTVILLHCGTSKTVTL